MRRASEADRPAIEAFLKARAVTSMFPLSNLARHGMDGDHARSMSFWMVDGADGPTDILCVTREGMVMPSFDTVAAVEAAANVLHGRDVIGVVGAARQARPLIDALGLAGATTELDDDDPQFDLPFAEMIVPDGPGELVPLADVDRSQMIEWRRLYGVEALGLPDDKAAAQAETDIDGYLAADTHRVLIGADGPMCLTGFNAEAPGIVQIGGVYTPVALRGRGHARHAVALHLLEAGARGVTRATLFASGMQAVRAYEAIGFRKIGLWTLFVLANPERING